MLLLLLLLLFIILSQTIFLETETTTTTLTLKAKNLLGKPMDETEIRIFKDGELHSKKTTGEDGKATFLLGEGEYKIKAKKGKIKRSFILKTVKIG